MRRRRSCRGVALVEGALAFLVFALLVAGILDLGLVGFAGNAVTFAAHRAARYASLRGSTSGHAASAADIESSAIGYASPLNPANLSVTVRWLPDNTPGSSVEVTVAYSIRPAVLSRPDHPLSLQSTARQRIVQ